MSDREKRLLFFLLIVGFLIVNAVVLKVFYFPKLKEARGRELNMNTAHQQAIIDLEDQESQRSEMDWLMKYEPQATTPQKAQTDLEQLANREAQRRGLTVNDTKPMTAVAHPSLFYHRARVEVEVSGREQVLYQWMDRLNSPPDLRSATMIRMNPKRDDDTQVDCLVVLEPWFVPKKAGPPDA